ncbi:hypothetical protein SCATT_13270 [Streptantibioticus cattleyicolor NRRL 8057 = DSM 46488]|uniref:Uncharacterized protein n=1 Tax=Streptantibioticus cattleyicolor (strain ATCC 35852 / DSM 46488 / JCM 4925 / NBRC 14057 / NRRL 8057) TaxID=1003195 RepID=G8WTQ5_STREN|nr:hypothetical protein SCATT_13270 [Streptantibioticus cattleyicolor NRRL 8057 = DSM 46488]
MTDDLHQSHLPVTTTSIPMPTHTSPVKQLQLAHRSHRILGVTGDPDAPGT